MVRFTQFDVDSIQARQRQSEIKRGLVPTENTPYPEVTLKNKESELHQKICNELKRLRWAFFHGSTAHRTKRTVGEPDFIIAASEGRTFYIEVKRHGGKLAPCQYAMKHALQALGHKHFVVHSFKEFLQAIE